MQKLYRLVQAITFAVLSITQHSLQAQNCCVDCQADVKVVTNNQVLLEKIELKEGTTTTLNTNVYVSYRSGNAQKFWANVAIATAGVAVSTQLNSSTPIGAGDSKVQSSISPIVPLGVSVATLPGIWKNRPRGVPQAGLWLQHRDKKGKLLETWEQPISKEAKNGAELLTVAIEKPLTEGTLEVYLQNGSKNGVYYWGLQTVKNLQKLPYKVNPQKLINNNAQKASRIAGYSTCPEGYLSNGEGGCHNPFTGEIIGEIWMENNDPILIVAPAQPSCPDGCYYLGGNCICNENPNFPEDSDNNGNTSYNNSNPSNNGSLGNAYGGFSVNVPGPGGSGGNYGGQTTLLPPADNPTPQEVGPKKADHRLTEGKLPPRWGKKQILGTCVFETIANVSQYFDGNVTIGNAALSYALSSQKNFEDVLNNGVTSFTDLVNLANNFFNTTLIEVTFNAIKQSIDNGSPIMGSVFGHEVMITGYNNDGTIEVYDSAIGGYAIRNVDDFYLLISIASHK
jgi:hypothetical protein